MFQDLVHMITRMLYSNMEVYKILAMDLDHVSKKFDLLMYQAQGLTKANQPLSLK